MNRALGVLALLAALLALWERALVRAEHAQRAERSRVGPLLPEEERTGLPLAALRVEHGGERLLYGKLEGQWRCLDFHRAYADPRAIGGLIEALLRAQGFVVSDAPDEAATYGIGTPETTRVELCGAQVLHDPSGDVLVTFDLGTSVGGRDAAFVRLRGSREVWQIDSDPRSLLTPPAPGLPPLLEPSVVPRAWPGWASGLASITVARAGEAPYVLERRAVEVSEEDLRQGRAPWAWILDPGPDELRATDLQAHAFSLFVQRIPYTGLVERDRRETLIPVPVATLTLRPVEGDPLELTLGPPLPPGEPAAAGVPLWNPWSQGLYLLPRDVLALVAPDPALFREESDENPWDPWLRR